MYILTSTKLNQTSWPKSRKQKSAIGHNVFQSNTILIKVTAYNTNTTTTQFYWIQPWISRQHLYFINSIHVPYLWGLTHYSPSSIDNNNITVTTAIKEHNLAAIFNYVLETILQGTCLHFAVQNRHPLLAPDHVTTTPVDSVHRLCRALVL